MFNAVNNILFADDAMLYTQDKHVHITDTNIHIVATCVHTHWVIRLVMCHSLLTCMALNLPSMLLGSSLAMDCCLQHSQVRLSMALKTAFS